MKPVAERRGEESVKRPVRTSSYEPVGGDGRRGEAGVFVLCDGALTHGDTHWAVQDQSLGPSTLPPLLLLFLTPCIWPYDQLILDLCSYFLPVFPSSLNLLASLSKLYCPPFLSPPDLPRWSRCQNSPQNEGSQPRGVHFKSAARPAERPHRPDLSLHAGSQRKSLPTEGAPCIAFREDGTSKGWNRREKVKHNNNNNNNNNNNKDMFIRAAEVCREELPEETLRSSHSGSIEPV
ncbi:hypothetical protein EYF80_051654 [Liparis tanakae]|uniref:Uncharacterized protein n=1 Tax=Liparis tanakae TaxID=230148 RepID=A0A4Z2FAB4_9TELE|nr:hypothetical protein EYF80_051654 [Liparis tanakae]